MKANNYPASACRYCRFYNPEGRRGGVCSQLNVLVKAHWKSCQFACSAFNNDWETSPEIAILEKSFTLGCATPSASLETENDVVTNQKDNLDYEEMVSS